MYHASTVLFPINKILNIDKYFECESQTQVICHFHPLNALFNFAAWVVFCKKFKTKLRHRSQKGANGRNKMIEN